MNSLAFLVPIAFLFGVVALTSFLWSVRAGRFNDPDGMGERVRVRDQGESRFNHHAGGR